MLDAPTGISWNTIPRPQATVAEQYVEATRMCWRATHFVDAECNQPLRGTFTTETLTGPNTWRLAIDPDTGNGKFLPARWPIANVYNIQVAATTAFPPNWYLLPTNAYTVSGGFNENPAVSFDPGAAGAESYLIEIGGGYLGPWRNSNRVQVAYVHGWPHTTLTQDAVEGATTISVDDVTGFTGLTPTIYDEPNDEVISVDTVTANNPTILPPPSNLSIPTGAGTLTLSAGTQYPHRAGQIVSTLPYTVQQAVILHCTAQALTRGGSAITAQQMSAKTTSTTTGINDLVSQAQALLLPYHRVI